MQSELELENVVTTHYNLKVFQKQKYSGLFRGIFVSEKVNEHRKNGVIFVSDV